MARRRGTDTEGRKFTPKRLDEVWEKGKKIPGRDPDLYRKDPAGNVIYKPSYGRILRWDGRWITRGRWTKEGRTISETWNPFKQMRIKRKVSSILGNHDSFERTGEV